MKSWRGMTADVVYTAETGESYSCFDPQQTIVYVSLDGQEDYQYADLADYEEAVSIVSNYEGVKSNV